MAPFLAASSKNIVTPNVLFRVITSDPTVALKLALSGFGIAILPLWMAKKPDFRSALTPILPKWTLERELAGIAGPHLPDETGDQRARSA